MNLTQKDAPAFGHGAENGHCCGLTKREYFAAMMMQGLLANPNSGFSAEVHAQYAVKNADALIRELNK